MPERRYAEIAERHRDRVYTLARHILRDPEDAADVTQDVLLKLWHHLDGIDGEPRPWLLKVTRNACFDLLRQRRSERSNLGLEADPETLRWTADDGPGPERLAASADLGEHLRRAVAELDEPYRSAILLREVQQLKYREISEILDVPMNTVKVHIHRARRRLREHMREVMTHAPA